MFIGKFAPRLSRRVILRCIWWNGSILYRRHHRHRLLCLDKARPPINYRYVIEANDTSPLVRAEAGKTCSADRRWWRCYCGENNNLIFIADAHQSGWLCYEKGAENASGLYEFSLVRFIRVNGLHNNDTNKKATNLAYFLHHFTLGIRPSSINKLRGIGTWIRCIFSKIPMKTNFLTYVSLQ